MKINETMVDGTTVWVPSDWVQVTVLHWPGRMHRYAIWKAICQQPFGERLFDFEHQFDVAAQQTWASVLHLLPEKTDRLPLPLAQIRVLTTPKAMVKRWLPRRLSPFTLLAYRWQGDIELCAYRMGLLQQAQRGQGGEAGIAALWSRVVQTMPVLAAAPLYSMDASLTACFAAHHGTCRTLPIRRDKIAQIFKVMQ